MRFSTIQQSFRRPLPYAASSCKEPLRPSLIFFFCCLQWLWSPAAIGISSATSCISLVSTWGLASYSEPICCFMSDSYPRHRGQSRCTLCPSSFSTKNSGDACCAPPDDLAICSMESGYPLLPLVTLLEKLLCKCLLINAKLTNNTCNVCNMSVMSVSICCLSLGECNIPYHKNCFKNIQP